MSNWEEIFPAFVTGVEGGYGSVAQVIKYSSQNQVSALCTNRSKIFLHLILKFLFSWHQIGLLSNLCTTFHKMVAL